MSSVHFQRCEYSLGVLIDSVWQGLSIIMQQIKLRVVVILGW